jgi:hypothetical protein
VIDVTNVIGTFASADRAFGLGKGLRSCIDAACLASLAGATPA